MGGNAFATHNPPLPTPRMPPQVFRLIQEQTLSILRQHYTHVDSAIEAPGKTNYGDVDVLVSSSLDLTLEGFKGKRKEIAEHLATVLGAKAWITEIGNPVVNLALPWPKIVDGRINETRVTQEEDEKKYIQLDIHICPTPAEFAWELFHTAHGDLWNILGTTIRPFGLTVNNHGLYLRIPEIEQFHRKKSMIFLTSDPNQVLDLLGLDQGKWWKEFPSKQEMFEYAAGCKMFAVKEKEAVEDGEMEGDVVGEIGAEGGGEVEKKKLKHNDRQRMSKRPIFKQWIEEFIPKAREEGKYSGMKVTREQVRDEAFKKFGGKEEYEKVLGDWLLVRHKDKLWGEVIKGSVPIDDVDPAFRGAAIREVKGVIMEGKEFEGMVPDAARKDEKGFHDLEAVHKFVVENWKRAGEIGWERQQQRARETMMAKQEKMEEIQKAKEEKSV
jgi:hypothetical protein